MTIVLVACIAGYIAYYVLELFSSWRMNRKYGYAAAHDDNEEERTDTMYHTTVTTMEDDRGNNVTIVEEETITISTDEDAEDEEIGAEMNEIILSDEVIVAQPGEEPADEDIVPKKHKVKNIAEGVSREDILQDKHEKNLQKVKYEAVLYKQRNDMAGYEKKLIE